jgi:hypothetical protein
LLKREGFTKLLGIEMEGILPLLPPSGGWVLGKNGRILKKDVQ